LVDPKTPSTKIVGFSFSTNCFIVHAMQLQVFIICDSFKIESDNEGRPTFTADKFFSIIAPPATPCSIPFSVVSGIVFEADEHGEHQIEIRICDADMKQVIDAKTKKELKTVRNFTIPKTNMSHVEFWGWRSGGACVAKYGDYYFSLLVDGKSIGRLPLHVVPSETPIAPFK
jgi:hypothetical protein